MKKYVVMTADGCWGKGDDLYEAAKNANCYSLREANVYEFDSIFVEDMIIGDMGNMSIQLTPLGIVIQEQNEKVNYRCFYSKYYCEIKFIKSKKTVQMKTLPPL